MDQVRADDDSGRAGNDSGRADDDWGRADIVGEVASFVHGEEIEAGSGAGNPQTAPSSGTSTWCGRARPSRATSVPIILQCVWMLAPGNTDVTDAQKAELDRRLADHEANPDDVVPWSEVKAYALARIGR